MLSAYYENLVVSKALYGDYGLWVRPYGMFFEDVEYNGALQKWFEYQNSQ